MFLRPSVDGKGALINFPLDLVELESLCASQIADKIVDCLLKNGYTIELLQELFIGFCSDGASVMLWTKSGSGSCLKTNFLILYCGIVLIKDLSLLYEMH